ncbi:MAG: SCP2 sterol-binding domain-containing protein [Oceanospirillaceae bacterium]|jgi:putative sterol carrier protein|nr:SCP2 sterol-binding domain-containing protein [Oceanospirillaceae bacterium]MBT4442313.1 SCP2 sterol-binding domain-containing protein [Oceanospirillaceae bacterium]MBT6076366.1 SCP2 sterol-binding domain-containing protein [Oceanospirillaceae bacterium]
MAVAEIMAKMQSAFVADEADGLQATFQFCIADDDDFYVTIDDANCAASLGNHADPEITMSMDSDTLMEIVSGKLDGMAAFMGGRLQAEGDVMLGTRLSQLFELS